MVIGAILGLKRDDEETVQIPKCVDQSLCRTNLKRHVAMKKGISMKFLNKKFSSDKFWKFSFNIYLQRI